MAIYFSKLLQKKREKPVKAGDKCKAKPQFYGETLTLDEVKERYEQAQAEKQQTQKGTGTKVAKKKGYKWKRYKVKEETNPARCP